MSVTIKTSGNPIRISHAIAVSVSVINNAIIYQVMVDGSLVGTVRYIDASTAVNVNLISDSLVIPVTAGTHQVQVMFSQNIGNTVTAISSYRTMTVEEMPNS